MGRLSQHPGHNAAARERIDRAREAFETRASRRKKQTWPGVGPRDGKRKTK